MQKARVAFENFAPRFWQASPIINSEFSHRKTSPLHSNILPVIFPSSLLIAFNTFSRRGTLKLIGAEKKRGCLTHVGVWDDFLGLAGFAGLAFWRVEPHRRLLRDLRNLHFVSLIRLHDDRIFVTVILLEEEVKNNYSVFALMGKSGRFIF